jgi:hypothetical protein
MTSLKALIPAAAVALFLTGTAGAAAGVRN